MRILAFFILVAGVAVIIVLWRMMLRNKADIRLMEDVTERGR